MSEAEDSTRGFFVGRGRWPGVAVKVRSGKGRTFGGVDSKGEAVRGEPLKPCTLGGGVRDEKKGLKVCTADPGSDVRLCPETECGGGICVYCAEDGDVGGSGGQRSVAVEVAI